jgi:hypothetical protein
VLDGIGVNGVEVIVNDGVYVGMVVTISVWVGLTCKVTVATEPTGFWLVIWIGELDLPGRLQAERTAISERVIEINLYVFNFAFMIAMKVITSTINLHDPTEIHQFMLVIFNHIQKLPRPHQSTGEFLPLSLGGGYL